MHILEYTEEHTAFRQRLRDFLAREVLPYLDAWEEQRQVPREAWKGLGRRGFLCPTVPAEFGGPGKDFLHSVIVIEELARTNHSGLMAGLHSDVVVPYIESYASAELKQRFLPGCVSGDLIAAVAMSEPGAGSDLSSLQTTAEDRGEEVVINGTKTFISNGISCDLVVLAARDPMVDNPYEAVSLYVVEAGTPGFEKGRKLDKMGMHSQDTAELFFQNCRIPAGNRLGEKGRGFYMLMDKLQQERLVCSIGAVAAAEFVWERTVDHCKQAGQNGRPKSKAQDVQFALVEMATEITMGRTFVEKLIAEHSRGEQVVVETSMAKYWTTDLAWKLARECLDLWGEEGLSEDCPIVRAFRDIRVMSIYAGTNEIMKGIAAKFMGLSK